MARLSLTLLGGFHPPDSGAPLALPTRKAQALLAFLAMPSGLAHPRQTGEPAVGSTWRRRRGRAFARRSTRSGRACGGPIRRRSAWRRTRWRWIPGVSVDVAGFLQGVAARTRPRSRTPSRCIRAISLRGWRSRAAVRGLAPRGARAAPQQALEGLGRLLAHQRAGATEAAVQTALRLLALDPLQESASPGADAALRRDGGAGRRSASISSAWQRSRGSGRSPRPRRRPSTRTSCAAARGSRGPKAGQSERLDRALGLWACRSGARRRRGALR